MQSAHARLLKMATSFRTGPLVIAHREKVLAYDIFQQCFVHHYKSWIDTRKADRVVIPKGRCDRHVQVAAHITKTYVQRPEHAVGKYRIDKGGRVTIRFRCMGRFKVLYVI
ncbi:hypothetical protein ONS95_009996 [Cadophora gregata]|uniref:uncharacterized protein n=1 Tax=Cadophora gregata TaxID=51156 RepID=UPI0026DAAB07|nr:uncharacterized protein ONS95_009996 [Cadophora gregata]KAK0121711.1 hypothetical protein ONS95_009996 [Cadophora gregata]